MRFTHNSLYQQLFAQYPEVGRRRRGARARGAPMAAACLEHLSRAACARRMRQPAALADPTRPRPRPSASPLPPQVRMAPVSLNSRHPPLPRRFVQRQLELMRGGLAAPAAFRQVETELRGELGALK